MFGRRGATRFSPQAEFDAHAIATFNVYDIGEAVRRVEEAIGAPGRSILIVNGRRIADPSVFATFPPDALVRIEVLPVQANALYGDGSNGRVLNLILEPRFQSRDLRVDASAPTAGGTTTFEAEVRRSEIVETDTNQIGLSNLRRTHLRGDERRWTRNAPLAETSTLIPATDVFNGLMSATREFGAWSGSANANLRLQELRLQTPIGGVLTEFDQSSRGLTMIGGVAGNVADWSVRLGLEAQASVSEQSGLAETRSRNATAVADISATRMATITQGFLVANVSARIEHARSTASSSFERSRFEATHVNLRGALTIPVSSTSAEGWNRLGDLNATIALRASLSDGAAEPGLESGFAWAPAPGVSVEGQWTRSREQPASDQRFAAMEVGAPRRIYDFATGQDVEILPLLGGNPALKAQTSEQISLAIHLGPFSSWRVLGGVNVLAVDASDAIGALPAVTPGLERAFPGRFVRAEDGRLVSIDFRPINLRSLRSRSVSTGFTFDVPEEKLGIRQRDGTALQIGFNQTWSLEDRILVQEGFPELDRLAGDAGGASRFQTALRIDGRYDHWNLNIAARWRTRSRSRIIDRRDDAADLVISSLATMDAKITYIFARTGQPGDTAFRTSLEIVNVFDARPEAVLGDGRPAPGYGRDDQDPLGRALRLTVTRRF